MKRSKAPSNLAGASKRTFAENKLRDPAVSNPTFPVKQAGLKAASGTSQSLQKTQISTTKENAAKVVFRAVYRKKTTKKHKCWDGDGFLVYSDSTLTLFSEERTLIRSTKNASCKSITVGQEISCFGQLDVEITEEIEYADFQKRERVQFEEANDIGLHTPKASILTSKKLMNSMPINQKSKHDYDKHDALVMPSPYALPAKEIIHVVVDPIISKYLRPHQREGVSFLYKCVMLGDTLHGEPRVISEGSGAILADEMGLALIWTLTKQSPYKGMSPPVKRTLIVCPASLLNNWNNEFTKWLGKDIRIKVYLVSPSSTEIHEFAISKIYQVMIIGYEKMKALADQILACKFDLVIADEGHRLKNKKLEINNIFASFTTKRRIILSGTLIQNDLAEFHAMVDWVIPGILGSFTVYNSKYASHVTSKKIGYKQKLDELVEITSKFILRRTAEVNVKYLPRRTEVIICIGLSKEQKRMYKETVDSISQDQKSNNLLENLSILRKLCNSPFLTQPPANNNESASSLLANFYSSSKLKFLMKFINNLHKTGEKVVIVSHFTKTLDLIQSLLGDYRFVRIDGSTPSQKRQEIVDSFSMQMGIFVFLLSSKAGGVGLNITAASRLIMMDIDWNPSTDQQAMARIWRDGQTKPVIIYRLLSSFTIDERIYQRQISKMALSKTVLDDFDDFEKQSFTSDELRDLFSYTDNEMGSLTFFKASECDFKSPFEGVTDDVLIESITDDINHLHINKT